MKDHSQNPAICSVDPITLGAIALGALAGGGAAVATGAMGGGGGGGGGQPAPTPQPAPQQSRPAAAPQQSNPVGSSGTALQAPPTFLGASATPERRGFGGNTLLGQP